MTDDKLYTSLSANTIMAILTNHVQRTRLTTSSTDKHYSLDSEDDFRSGCRNVSHQQQFFSELHSPGRSLYTNYWYSWVQTIYYIKNVRCKPSLHDLSFAGVWLPCCLTSSFVVVGRSRPLSMPLATLTVKKGLHGFMFLRLHEVLFLNLWCRAAGAPL